MRVEYDLNADDWADFGEYCVRTAPEGRLAKRRGMVSAALTTAVLCALVWLKFGLSWPVGAAIGGACWALYWPHRLVSHARAHMRSRKRLCLTGRHFAEATPEALITKCEVAESTTKWSGVHHVTETAHHVFVMLSDVQGFVVPKARIRSGDLDQFVREAQTYARSSS
jgi:hypothetical protein